MPSPDPAQTAQANRAPDNTPSLALPLDPALTVFATAMAALVSSGENQIKKIREKTTDADIPNRFRVLGFTGEIDRSMKPRSLDPKTLPGALAGEIQTTREEL